MTMCCPLSHAFSRYPVTNLHFCSMGSTSSPVAGTERRAAAAWREPPSNGGGIILGCNTGVPVALGGAAAVATGVPVASGKTFALYHHGSTFCCSRTSTAAALTLFGTGDPALEERAAVVVYGGDITGTLAVPGGGGPQGDKLRGGVDPGFHATGPTEADGEGLAVRTECPRFVLTPGATGDGHSAASYGMTVGGAALMLADRGRFQRSGEVCLNFTPGIHLS